MVISGRGNHGEYQGVERHTFQRAHKFKYPDVTMNSANNSQNEIKTRTTAMGKCYRGLANIIKSKRVSA